MRNSPILPMLDQLKDQAKRLRTRLAQSDNQISHAGALELIAGQYGYKDWNTLHAACGNQNAGTLSPVTVGQAVRGQYLGQSFTGKVLSVDFRPSTGRYRVTFQFDEAVDVVQFEGMSSMRKRVSCFLNTDGKTVEKTSDGQPHLVLENRAA